MTTYLLTWKPSEWGYEQLEERLKQFDSGKTLQKWSCGNTKNILVGSRVFLTKQGKGFGGIFGSGYVTQEPFQEPHFDEGKRKEGKKSLYVMVDFDRLYNPLSEIKIDRDELEAFDPKVWDSQGSGKTIPGNVASNLESLWLERTGGASIPFADEISPATNVKEGSAKQVLVNAYERNPEARERCIRKWGLNCVVCKFHFGLYYGQLGKGYIHVHHLKPLAEIREEYELNPEEDLRPVCPNCHSMLHRKKPALSIEELQKIVATYGERLSK